MVVSSKLLRCLLLVTAFTLIVWIMRCTEPRVLNMTKWQQQFLKNRNKIDIIDIPLWQRMLCIYRETDTNYKYFEERKILEDPIILPTIYSDITPNVSSSNIFLHETSCNPKPLYREWCSVESWAGQNPESEVWFVLTSPLVHDKIGMMTRLLHHYHNIRVVGANIIEDFRDTPLWDIFTSQRWIRGTDWPPNNLGNILRIAMVWRWGGFYSDTDTICIKSIKGLENVVGLHDKQLVNGAVFHGQPHHEFYWNLMKDLKVNFKPDIWGHNGPASFTRLIKQLCQGINFEKVDINPIQCANISILPEASFNPISFYNFQKYFQDGKGLQMELFNATYTLHFWNLYVRNIAIRIGSESILDAAAKKYCPVVYREAAYYSNCF